MLNRKQVLIVVLVALLGLGIDAYAGEPTKGSQVGYDITCGTLALIMEDEVKAKYYAELVPPDTSNAVLKSWVVQTISDVQKYAGMQDLPTRVVAGYGFTNYGCDRPFI